MWVWTSTMMGGGGFGEDMSRSLLQSGQRLEQGLGVGI